MRLEHVPRNLLVTGGCGFIGGHFIRAVLADAAFGGTVTNLDLLTYAADPTGLDEVAARAGGRYRFVRGDVADAATVARLFDEATIDTVVHFAAESHVDRSISGPAAFLRTNVTGTLTLLEAARAAWAGRSDVRFHHVSTDEVFGSLGPTGKFSETTAYDPRSPYSASKAASDHLVRAWHHTYGLPISISTCSNNYGPYQFPEKLIPRVIVNLIHRRPAPVYGDGLNVRDWLHVEDHARALWLILTQAKAGQTYAVGGGNEWTNRRLVEHLARRLAALQGVAEDELLRLITIVPDRPGHDRRYAIDFGKFERDLGWRPRVAFAEGLDRTLRWYLDNTAWWEPRAA